MAKSIIEINIFVVGMIVCVIAAVILGTFIITAYYTTMETREIEIDKLFSIGYSGYVTDTTGITYRVDDRQVFGRLSVGEVVKVKTNHVPLGDPQILSIENCCGVQP